MATEYQDLGVGVTLIDNASDQITRIKRQIDEFGGQQTDRMKSWARTAASMLPRLRGLGSGFSRVNTAADGMTRSLPDLQKWAGSFDSASESRLKQAISAAAENQKSFTGQLRRMRNLQRQTSISIATQKEINKALYLSGLTDDEIAEVMGSMADASVKVLDPLNDIMRDLQNQMGGTEEWKETTRVFYENFHKLAEQGDYEGMFNLANKYIKDVEELSKDQTPQEIAQARHDAWEAIYGPRAADILSRIDAPEVKHATDQQKKDWARRAEIAEQMEQYQHDINDAWRRIKEAAAKLSSEQYLDLLNKGMELTADLVEKLSKSIISILGNLAKLKIKLPTVPLSNWSTMSNLLLQYWYKKLFGGGAKKMSYAGEGDNGDARLWRASFDESVDDLRDDTRQSDLLVEQIKQLYDYLREMRTTMRGETPAGGAGGGEPPRVVALAEGGVVEKPTNALVGEKGPEAVVPLGRQGGGGVVNKPTLTQLGLRGPEAVVPLNRQMIQTPWGEHPQETRLRQFAVPAGASSDQADRPGRYQGKVSLGGETFNYASGGAGRGSIPYGEFPINVGKGDIGTKGQKIGSVATLGGQYGTIQDPKYPKQARTGVQIHPLQTHGDTSRTLDRLNTEGCFGVPPQDWPRFKEALLREAGQHPEGLNLTIGRDGMAQIAPRPERSALDWPMGREISPMSGRADIDVRIKTREEEPQVRSTASGSGMFEGGMTLNRERGAPQARQQTEAGAD